jgi:hypothetical protein
MSFVEIVVQEFEKATGVDPRSKEGGVRLADLPGDDSVEKIGHLIEASWNALFALASALDG